MRQGICPSCGLETLETIMAQKPSGDSGQKPSGSREESSQELGLREQMLLFECTHCHWQGSTETVNCV